MEDITQPKINIKEQKTIQCEKCACKYFKEVVMLKKIPKLLTGNSEDVLVPFPTYRCDDCGYVNEDFELF